MLSIVSVSLVTNSVGRQCDLAQDAIPAERRGEFLAENPDRDRAIVFAVVRETHGGHATGAEFTLDAVAAREGGGEAILGRFVCVTPTRRAAARRVRAATRQLRRRCPWPRRA